MQSEFVLEDFFVYEWTSKWDIWVGKNERLGWYRYFFESLWEESTRNFLLMPWQNDTEEITGESTI